jgi:hypothetical protein
VDLRSLSLGEKIAAGCGAVYFVCLFLSWLEGLTAWELFDIVDVLLALLALVAVVLPLARAAGRELPVSPSNKAILTRIGVILVTVTVAFFLEGAERGIGIFLALLAAVGVLYGAISTPGEETRSRRRERSRRPLAEQDLEEPPPGMESWRRGGLLDDESESVGSGASAAESEPTETRSPRARPERGGGSAGR